MSQSRYVISRDLSKVKFSQKEKEYKRKHEGVKERNRKEFETGFLKE